jgi:MazG family protein
MRYGEAMERLAGIMHRLRGPGGCPWDREQTMHSLRPYLLEEAYEVLEAMDSGDTAAHREELGDLLLQVVFQAEIAREQGLFDLADVCDAISGKLMSRHPHVFGDVQVSGSAEVLRNWAALKAKEKAASGKPHSALDGVPRELNALVRAERITEKAGRVGFDWPDAAPVWAKVREELGELERAAGSGDTAATEHELGDALFALVNLSRHLRVHPEDALRAAVNRFDKRFRYIEARLREGGKTPAESTLAEMDALWDEAKSAT